ncbi:uncharacterized protein LOC112573247 isoform X2 [Pomacea canaliculata]|nr:uncharacterized protein LOC112573247 isoform X2 [Pomacea canaliculata]
MMFAGANPMAVNEEQQTCRQVAPERPYMIKYILRKSRENESVPFFITPTQTKPFLSQDGHFSIALDAVDQSASTSEVTTVAMIRTKAPQNLNPPITCYDGETFWGHGIEYMSRTTTQAKIKFFLHDRVDTFHRLVIKIKSEEKQEKEYDATVEELPLHEEQVSFQDKAYVAVACAHVELDKSGSISLLYGPASDTIKLGPDGGTFEFSKDPGVKISASCTNQRGLPEGALLNLQVMKPPLEDQKTPPEPSPPSEAAETTATLQGVLLAMTYFLYLRGLPSLASSTTCTATLPLCEQFNKEQSHAYVFVRPDGQGQEGDNVDEEMKRWEQKPEPLVLEKNNSSVEIPTGINETTTVVQIAEGADPQEVKRAVAEQHMKSMLVPVQLYVLEKLDQAIENERCCLVIAVKARQEGSLITESQDQSESYNILKVSDTLYVPHSLQMKISLHQKNPVTTTSAVILFQHGVHTDKNGHSCGFHVCKQETTQTKIIFKIEKSKLLEQCDQTFNWKPLIDLEVCIPPFRPVTSSPESETVAEQPSSLTPEVDETNECPIDDRLLNQLARKIPASDVYHLGLQLKLRSWDVDNIMQSSSTEDMFTKCFKILRAARDLLPKNFVKRLRTALSELQLISQLDWFLQELKKSTAYESRWNPFHRLPQINHRNNQQEEHVIDEVSTNVMAEMSLYLDINEETN